MNTRGPRGRSSFVPYTIAYPVSPTIVERQTNGPRLLYLPDMIPMMTVEIHPAMYGSVESNCA